jgi:hypothetical protein
MSNTQFLVEPEPLDREQSLEAYIKQRLQSLDRAVGGYTSVSLTGLSGNVDLSPAQAKHRTIRLTGTPAAAVTVRIPAALGSNADIVFSNVCAGSSAGVTIKSTGANTGNPSGVSLATGFTRTAQHDGESAYPVTNEAARTTSGGLNSGLAAFWKLGEVSGARADSVGANHLTDNNPVTQAAAGKVGSAAQFTAASSESLSIADNAALSTGDIDFTLAAWVYFDSKGADRVILGKIGAGSAEYLLRFVNTSDRFRFYCANGGSNGNVLANPLGSPALATWYFVVAWHDAAANTINIQVNAGAVNSAGYSAGVADGAQGFRLGAQDNSVDFWNGRIDAAGVWKRVLSSAEVTSLYNSGSGREYPF